MAKIQHGGLKRVIRLAVSLLSVGHTTASISNLSVRDPTLSEIISVRSPSFSGSGLPIYGGYYLLIYGHRPSKMLASMIKEDEMIRNCFSAIEPAEMKF